jgi:hypothetical protein
MDFWRSEAYMKFFEFLDSRGGFYYEVSPTTKAAVNCADEIYPLLEMG